jgi:hypothetical protein
VGDPLDLTARRKAQLDAELAKLPPEDRTRFETLKVAADKTREAAHFMLDGQLDRIMPELLTHIDGGGTFGVFVVDPSQMPVMPAAGPKLVGSNGKPL